VQVNDSHLQYAAVQIADTLGLLTPRILQSLVRLEIFAAIEEVNAFASARGKRTGTGISGV
jgi:hypothetical protein